MDQNFISSNEFHHPWKFIIHPWNCIHKKLEWKVHAIFIHWIFTNDIQWMYERFWMNCNDIISDQVEIKCWFNCWNSSQLNHKWALSGCCANGCWFTLAQVVYGSKWATTTPKTQQPNFFPLLVEFQMFCEGRKKFIAIKKDLDKKAWWRIKFWSFKFSLSYMFKKLENSILTFQQVELLVNLELNGGGSWLHHHVKFLESINVHFAKLITMQGIEVNLIRIWLESCPMFYSS
jgi:hypothetical protein